MPSFSCALTSSCMLTMHNTVTQTSSHTSGFCQHMHHFALPHVSLFKLQLIWCQNDWIMYLLRGFMNHAWHSVSIGQSLLMELFIFQNTYRAKLWSKIPDAVWCERNLTWWLIYNWVNMFKAEVCNFVYYQFNMLTNISNLLVGWVPRKG